MENTFSAKMLLKYIKVFPPDMTVGKVIETAREYLRTHNGLMPKRGTQKADVFVMLGNAWLSINGQENDPYFRYPEVITVMGITKRLKLAHHALASLYLHRLLDDGLLTFHKRYVVGHRPIMKCWELTELGWRCFKDLNNP